MFVGKALKRGISQQWQRFPNVLWLNIPTLKEHVPSKKTYARGNQMHFLKKDFSKARITRSRLRNKFLNKKTRKCDPLCETGITVFHF